MFAVSHSHLWIELHDDTFTNIPKLRNLNSQVFFSGTAIPFLFVEENSRNIWSLFRRYPLNMITFILTI